MGALSSVAEDLAVYSPFFGEAAPYMRAATNIAGTVQSFSEQEQAQDRELAELRQKQKANMQDLRERAALSRAEIAADAEAAERERRDALKRAVARQRAQFGAQGISPRGGSSEAVLLGLFDESEEQRKEREKGDKIRLGAVNQDIKSRKRLNVIQRTQLKERQKLERQSSLF